MPLPVKASDLIALGDLSDVQKLLVEHTQQAYVLIQRMTEKVIPSHQNQNSRQNAGNTVEAACLEGLGVGDLQCLFEMLTRTLSLPVMSDWPPMSENKYEDGFNPILLNENQLSHTSGGLALVKPQLTALQIKCLGIIHHTQSRCNSNLHHHLLPLVFDFLLNHSRTMWEVQPAAAHGDISKYLQSLKGGNSGMKNTRASLISSNPVGLSRRCLQLLANTYKTHANHHSLINQHICSNILKELSKPLAKVEDCVSWQIVAQTVLEIAVISAPIVEKIKQPIIKFRDAIPSREGGGESSVSSGRLRTSSTSESDLPEEFWISIYECAKSWFENLNVAANGQKEVGSSGGSKLITPQQQQIQAVLIERVCVFDQKCEKRT